MHDHIHRQIAFSRHADLQRAQSSRARKRSFPEKPPPRFRKQAAASIARAAARLDAESAQRAIAR
jgi:hypothetical protein